MFLYVFFLYDSKIKSIIIKIKNVGLIKQQINKRVFFIIGLFLKFKANKKNIIAGISVNISLKESFKFVFNKNIK